MNMYIVSEQTLASIAEAIREKSGTNKKLIFPQDFISAIQTMISHETKYDFFDGSYEIIPSINAQTINTQGKIMKENLNIKEIPYYEVSNDFGKTIYIGGNINGE